MSLARIGRVIDRLLADETLRIRLAIDPLDAIVELFSLGFDLTADEIDLFCRTDARLWYLADAVTVARP